MAVLFYIFLLMTIYIEDVIIENFLVTLLILLCLNKLFKTVIKKNRIILSSLVGATISVLYPLLGDSGILEVLFKLSVGVVIVYIYFGKSYNLAKYISFIFLTAFYGGINILVYYFAYGTMEIKDNFPTHILIAILFIVYYLFGLCVSLVKKNFVISNFVYNIKIINNNIELKDVAFLDSGNTLLDEFGEPIFIINLKLFNKLYKNINIEDILIKNYKNLKNPHYVKSGFASGSGKILVFDVDLLEILLNNKTIKVNNAKIGVVYSDFNKNFNCNMLLNIHAFI